MVQREVAEALAALEQRVAALEGRTSTADSEQESDTVVRAQTATGRGRAHK